MTRLTIAVSLVLISIGQVAVAQDDAKSGIDPFATKPSSSEETGSSPFQSKSTSKSKEKSKSFLPSFGSKKSSKSPARPTVLQKFARDSRIAMKKSKEVLMPWSKPKRTPTPITGMRPKPEEKKKFNPLASLFKPANEPQRVESINDWFRQPRPGFDD